MASFGILDADRQRASTVAKKAAVNRNVFEALKWANFGSVSVGDKADGTTTTPSLPAAPGLRIYGIGDVPLPISAGHAKLLKSKAWLVTDSAHHDVFQIEHSNVAIQNPMWMPSLGRMLGTVASKLGVNPSCVVARLDMLLFFEQDSHVNRCRNADEGPDVFGTLFVQLPSTFSGGEISVYDWDKDEKADFSVFSLRDNASFSCHVMAHSADSEYEIAKVTTGSRILLRYTLSYRTSGTKPMGQGLLDSMAPLKHGLLNLPPVDKMVRLPVERDYPQPALVRRGIKARSVEGRFIQVEGELIRAARANKDAVDGRYEALSLEGR